MNKVLHTSFFLFLLVMGAFPNQLFAQEGTPPCPIEPFFPGSIWANGCNIQNIDLAGYFEQPLQYVWIKSSTNSGNCEISMPELLSLNVGEIYDDFIAAGGFNGGASPMIGTTSWSFVTDNDSDDTSLSISEINAATCYSRCARVVGCTSFYGEASVTVQPCTTLPVELTRFNGKAEGCNINISWSSSSEENFSHYELERSNDGRTFEVAKTIKGSGSPVGSNYFFTDKEAGMENYYRLKMIDYDLSYEYSKMINVNSDCEATIKNIIVFPNPVGDDYINLKVESKEETNMLIKLVDIMGREVLKENIELKKGFNTFRYDVSELAGQIYFIKVGDQIRYRFTKTSQR